MKAHGENNKNNKYIFSAIAGCGRTEGTVTSFNNIETLPVFERGKAAVDSPIPSPSPTAARKNGIRETSGKK